MANSSRLKKVNLIIIFCWLILIFFGTILTGKKVYNKIKLDFETSYINKKKVSNCINFINNHDFCDDKKIILDSKSYALTQITDDSVNTNNEISAEKTITSRSGKRNFSVNECLTKSKGVFKGPSGRETYYNLNMSGVINAMKKLGYDYEYWIREDGVKMFGDYVICAANYSYYPKCSIIETSLGTAMVCDTGCAYGTIDIAVNW